MDDPFDELAGALNKRDQWLNEGGPPEVQAQKQQEDQKAEALPAVQSLRLEMAKRDSTVGKVQWTDESVPLQQRIGDFVQTHAVAEAQRKDKPDYDAKDWERIAGQAQQFFPGVDAEKLKQPFLEGRQQAWIGQGLAAAKEKYQGFEEPGRMTLLREGLPFATTGWNFWEKSQYADAKQRLAKGEYNPGDFARVAHFEKLQENKQNESLGKSALRTALNVGTFAGEAWAGGAALKGVGILPTIRMGGAAVAETPTLAARLIGKTALTRTAAQTALMPSMWLPQSVDQAMQKGGNWSDIKNLGPAYGMGMMQVGLLGAASKAGGSEAAAKLVPGIAEGGVKGWATRLVTGTGVAMSGQAGIDVTNGLLTSQFPVWGHKGYGTAVELAEGKEGAPKAMLMQLLTFALFNVGHAHNNPLGEARAADLADSKAMMDLGAAFVGRLKKAGYGEDAAYGEAIKAQKVLNDQIHGKDVTGAKASLSKMAQQYVDSLGERMKVDQLAAEQKAADMAARNPNVGQFRGQFGTAEPTAAPEGPVNAPGEAPAAKGQPATEAAKAPEPTPGTPESFAQRLASGKDTVADVFRDFHEQGGKPEGWTAIEGRAAELNPEYGAPKVPMSKTVPGVGRTVKPIPEAPESVFHITDYKTPSKSVGTAIDILARKGSAPRPLEVWDAGKGKGGREGFDANFKSSHVAFEFDTGKHTGEMIRGEAGKPQGRFTSTDPLRYNPGLKAIHYKGSEADPAFARLKAEVDDINADRADGKLMREYGHKEALDPVELKATEQVSKPAGPTAEPTPEAPVPRTPEPLTQAKFDAVFNRLNKGDNYVSVADIRDALPDTSKAEVDAMLLNLRKERQYTLKRSGVDQVQPRVLEAAIREDGDALTHVGRLPTASAAKEAPPRPHMNDVPMHIQEVLDRADLTPREKAVLEGRAQGNSHQDLEAEFGVKRQRVAQIETEAMAKLGVEHKSMAAWLEADTKAAPKGVANFDPEVIDRTVSEVVEKEGLDLTEAEIKQLPPELRKFATSASDDFDEAVQSVPTSKGVKDATDAFVREHGGNDPEALRREIDAAVQESLEHVQAGHPPEGVEGPAAQGNAEPAAAAPAAGREAASRELKFKTVAQEIQARGGISLKSFAEIHGKEITAEFQKEFPGMFRGRNLRGGSNNFEELVEDLVRHQVIKVPEGMKATDAILELIKGRALDLSQNLDAKYQAEAEAYDRAQTEVKKAGFSAKAVAEAGRLGEELAADEESQRQAEADRLSEADEVAAAQRPGATDFDPADFGRPITSTERSGLVSGGQEGEGPARPKMRETALANAKMDAERVQNGLPEILKPARLENQTVWDQAMERVEEDARLPQRLIDELIRKPRATTVEENAILLRQKVALQNEHERAMLEQIKAYQRKAPVAEIKPLEAREKEILDRIDELDQVTKKTGTEWGRAGQFRRQLAKEDFSLSSMLMQTAAAKGRALTEGEKVQVTETSKKIQQAQGEEATLRLQQKWKGELNQFRWQQKPITEKVQDLFSKWRRASILSSPVTIFKLSSAALARMAITPAEEAVGGIWGRMLPSIAAKAQLEAGLNFKAEVRAVSKAFTDGMKDAWDVLRTGKSELKVKYGTSEEGESTFGRFLEIPGRIHGALKAPVARAAFERAVEKLSAASIRQGLDPLDPAVSTRIMVEAYKASERSIFMQDNRVSDAYQRGIRYLERPDPTTGQVPPGAKGIATGMKFALPIVKVPTNIVAETFTNAFGLVTGSVRAAQAYARGIENLTPEQADVIMRSLKKGSLGAAMLALGFMNPDSVGGYYQQGQRRKDEDAEAGGLKLGGMQVPKYLVHNPLLETAQIGATIRRAIDSKAHKKDAENQSYMMGMMRAMLGLFEEVPFVRESVEVSKAYENPERFAGAQLKSAVIPAGVSWTAEQMDRQDAMGPKIKRETKTPLQDVQSGVPVLRQRLPMKLGGRRR